MFTGVGRSVQKHDERFCLLRTPQNAESTLFFLFPFSFSFFHIFTSIAQVISHGFPRELTREFIIHELRFSLGCFNGSLDDVVAMKLRVGAFFTCGKVK